MNRIEDDRDQGALRLEKWIELARETTRPALDEVSERAERGRLKRALANRPASAPPWRSWWLVAAALTLLGLGVFAIVHRSPHDLSFAVSGSTTGGSYIQAGDSAAAYIRFDEGTEVVLDPGSRARISSVTPHGAHLVLERGLAHVAVKHLDGAAWSIDAGPYEVLVIGTRFDVAWSGDDLRLQLIEGQVTVRGAVLSAPIQMRGGQELVADTSGQVTLRRNAAPLSNPASSAPSTSAAPTIAPTELGPPSSSATPTESASAMVSAAPVAKPRASWRERVGAGEFQSVIDEAERAGIGSTVDSKPLEDLVALADAARYAKRTDIAEAALVAQRSRFSGTAAATNAAFLLGRLKEDSLGNVSEAVGLYRAYLSEAPNGPFVAEALGRQMMALKRASKKEEAASAASTYLERFPNGPYASAAREMTEGR